MTHELQVNANRFIGFADIYEKTRPAAPRQAIDIIARYLNRKPACVVDLGSGTGLSTMVWAGIADEIIGIEPSPDMIGIANNKAEGDDSVRFLPGFSDATELADASADVVTCSQSFHWMDPERTLKEVQRILMDGGIFAVYDCDWPPVCRWEAENAYAELFSQVNELQTKHASPEYSAVFWPKEGHMENLRQYGAFRYVREVVFANAESCDADRYIALALSQGGLQSLLKTDAAGIMPYLEVFEEKIRSIFGEKELTVDFCYRMRLGVKQSK